MKIHLVGIKGVGMVALAQILQARGHQITGSDTSEDFVTKQALRKLGAPIFDFDPANITPDLDLVVHSKAFKPEHPELQRARELGIKIQNYPQQVAKIFNEKKGIAIAGTHGKTTTSSLLGHTLIGAGFDPDCIIGAPVVDFGRANAHSGDGELFVIEACEYQNSFHNYHPWSAIITNIDFDHPDAFKDEKEYEASFAKFARQVDPAGVVIVRREDATKIEHPRKITFDVADASADWSARDISFADRKSRFEALWRGQPFGRFELQFPGLHNISNALAVIAMCRHLDVPREDIAAGLQTFRGTARRQELRGELNGVPVIDDYAHHPTEIRATLAALRGFYPDRRMVVIFQSHTHTRTRALLDDFAQSFENADVLFVPEVFPSAREMDFDAKVSADELADAIRTRNPHLELIAGDHMLAEDEIREYARKVSAHIKPDDLIVTMGAGETDKLAYKILKG